MIIVHNRSVAATHTLLEASVGGSRGGAGTMHATVSDKCHRPATAEHEECVSSARQHLAGAFDNASGTAIDAAARCGAQQHLWRTLRRKECLCVPE